MSHLLHLDSSARRRSFSRQLGARFAENWRAGHPGAGYTYRDLAAEPVPFITEGWTEICDALLAAGITDPARYPIVLRTDTQRAAWAIVRPLLVELLAADTVLITMPMYNFTVPAALKAWIDQVTFPKMSLDARFVVVSARGGSYRPGSPRADVEHQENYLRDFFAGHFGVTDATFVAAELTNTVVDPALAHLADAHARSHRAAIAEIDRLSGARAAR